MLALDAGDVLVDSGEAQADVTLGAPIFTENESAAGPFHSTPRFNSLQALLRKGTNDATRILKHVSKVCKVFDKQHHSITPGPIFSRIHVLTPS